MIFEIKKTLKKIKLKKKLKYKLKIVKIFFNHKKKLTKFKIFLIK